MKYKVEQDFIVPDPIKYRIMYYNEKYDLWLTWSKDRYISPEQAERAIKKLK